MATEMLNKLYSPLLLFPKFDVAITAARDNESGPDVIQGFVKKFLVFDNLCILYFEVTTWVRVSRCM